VEENQNLKAVILLGRIPAKLVTTKKSTHNTILKKGETTYCMFYHPAYLLRDRSKIDGWTRDFDATVYFDWKRFLQDKHYMMVNNGRFAIMMKDIYKVKKIAFDLETTSLDSMDPDFDILGASISTAPNTAYWMPIKDLKPDYFKLFLKMVTDNSIKKTGHFIKFDILSMYRKWGVLMRGLAGDTGALSFLVDDRVSHSLQNVIDRFLPGYSGYKKQVAMKGGFEDVDPETLALYACGDADATYKLERIVLQVLQSGYKGSRLKKVINVYLKVILPSIYVLTEIENNGMCIDMEMRNKLDDLYQKEIARLEVDTKKIGLSNFNSTPQIQKLLFGSKEEGGLGLEPIKYTEKGSPSTDKDSLEKLYLRHNIPELKVLYELRRVGGVHSTFIKGIPDLVRSDGCIHSNYTYCTVKSSRFSSTAPNLQNLPRVETDVEFLTKYPAKLIYTSRFKDGLMAEFDFSQIEVRLMALMSACWEMVKTLSSGGDIHQMVADSINRDRSYAKRVNFGMIFRIGAKTLGEQLGITKKEAGTLIKDYFARFPEIEAYSNKYYNLSIAERMSYTIFGRRRRFDNQRIDDDEVGKQGMNLTIQSPAHDILCRSAWHVLRHLRKNNMKSKMVNVIHDSIILDCVKDEYEELKPVVVKIMRDTPRELFRLFDVQLEPACADVFYGSDFFDADVKVGKNWADMKEDEVPTFGFAPTAK
jgi:DNA polymerase-1